MGEEALPLSAANQAFRNDSITSGRIIVDAVVRHSPRGWFSTRIEVGFVPFT